MIINNFCCFYNSRESENESKKENEKCHAINWNATLSKRYFLSATISHNQFNSALCVKLCEHNAFLLRLAKQFLSCLVFMRTGQNKKKKKRKAVEHDEIEQKCMIFTYKFYTTKLCIAKWNWNGPKGRRLNVPTSINAMYKKTNSMTNREYMYCLEIFHIEMHFTFHIV